MAEYTELIKALLSASTVSNAWGRLMQDAAAAIEALQAEVKRLKEVIDELREAQTYIDHYGDKWLTSAKDVPTSAYNHGYMDGKNEAETAQPHWVSVDEPPKEEGRYWCATKFARHWIFYAAWYWNNVSDYTGVPVGEKEKADGFVFGENVVYPDWWMPIEPPQEVQDGQ